jgi:hypothetical protein
MTPSECKVVKDISLLDHSPSQILDRLKQDNPDSELDLRDIYNLLVSLRMECEIPRVISNRAQEKANGQHGERGGGNRVVKSGGSRIQTA